MTNVIPLKQIQPGAEQMTSTTPVTLTRRDTIQEYFERAEQSGIIDFHLRLIRNPDGLLDFYIRPQDRDGETGDFTVSGTFVFKIDNNVAAGSSR